MGKKYLKCNWNGGSNSNKTVKKKRQILKEQRQHIVYNITGKNL